MATDAYKKLRYKWDDYSRSLESVDKAIKKLTYDPFVIVANEEEESDRFNSLFSHPPTSFETQLFLLPNKFTLLSRDNLLLPNKFPSFPTLPECPPIVLERTEYPDWYFSSKEASSPVEKGLGVSSSFFEKLGFKSVEKKTRETREQLGYKSHYEQDIESRQLLVEKAMAIQVSIDKLRKDFIETFEKSKHFLSSLNDGDVFAIEKIITLSHEKHPLPKFLRKEFKASIDAHSQIALIEFKFPDYSGNNLVIGYTGKSYQPNPKFASLTQKKKYVKQCLYSLIIRSAYLAANVCVNDKFKSVVVNVEQDWFDPATGTPRSGLIASLQAPVNYLLSLDLAKLDPEACFKHLKGICTPSLQNISAIRPIFVLNKEDNRFIDGKLIDNQLESETNLASIPWEDFEHLVAQLFEWEFKKNGMEVKVTRASRDRGVDAILFDPDPLRGGKYVLQAKRYTRTVDVSAVRDLYGTLMNEGANRGILITTSSYGPDAYEFVKDKPISLVDGPNLIIMLQKHGKKYRIDLEEARRLNVE